MALLLLVCLSGTLSAQTETHRYTIDVAGIRVGTMTATRMVQAGDQTLYTLISDVKVNFLLYKVVIYYRVDNVFRGNQLMRSTVAARTNRGNYMSRTEWTGSHYDIVANQYKYTRTASEPTPIDYTVTNLFFSEPVNRSRAFAEYFGDYFTLARTPTGTYRANRDGREDEYSYENGQLVRIIKKNPIKNFVIRRVE